MYSLLQYLRNKYQAQDADKKLHAEIFWKLTKSLIFKLIVKMLERMSGAVTNGKMLSGGDDMIEVEHKQS